jgi:restriction system protein
LIRTTIIVALKGFARKRFGDAMPEGNNFNLPPWHYFHRYILEALRNGETLHRKDLKRIAAELAPLTREQRELKFEGGESVAEHRAGWAMSALTRAGAAERPARGYFRITDVGLKLLAEYKGPISKKVLMALPAWDDYQPTRQTVSTSFDESNDEFEGDPIELISSAVDSLEQAVASELLTKLRQGSPEFFEKAVLELLAAMGYGGVEKNLTHTGRTGDGGIDGVLDQDALGLNRVHVQAKRYADGNTIGRPDIQQFVGALGDKNATQGVFVTSSRFSQEALGTAERASEKIALIDGNKLVELMIKHKVGVQRRKVYEVVEIDEDFFE